MSEDFHPQVADAAMTLIVAALSEHSAAANVDDDAFDEQTVADHAERFLQAVVDSYGGTLTPEQLPDVVYRVIGQLLLCAGLVVRAGIDAIAAAYPSASRTEAFAQVVDEGRRRLDGLLARGG